MKNKISIPNLLLVAGEGTKSGKTSAVCRIIELLPGLEITGIKITPHFHVTTPGLISLRETNEYSIYEETELNSEKDSSRMLRAGAKKVFFVKTRDNNLEEVLRELIEFIPENSPVICESIALGNFITPGILVITSSDSVHKYKDINHLRALPHLSIKYEDLSEITYLPFAFRDGKWVSA